MKKLHLLLSLACLSSSAWTALPPLHQHRAELTAILNSPEIDRLLSCGEIISLIQHMENFYLINTDQSFIKVEVTYCHDSKICGPADFELTFTKTP